MWLTITLFRQTLTLHQLETFWKSWQCKKNLYIKKKLLKSIYKRTGYYYFHSKLTWALLDPNNCGQTAGVAIEVSSGKPTLLFPVSSCLSVTEALSQQGQRSKFFEYENVGLSGAWPALDFVQRRCSWISSYSAGNQMRAETKWVSSSRSHDLINWDECEVSWLPARCFSMIGSRFLSSYKSFLGFPFVVFIVLLTNLFFQVLY